MRRLAVLAAVAVAAGAALAAQGSPRFDAEFDGGLGGAWRTCHWWATGGCTIAHNGELEWYGRRGVSVADGVLRLTARPRRGHLPYASGMVSTGPGPHRRARFAFTYGRAEMRAKLPRQRGLWPAFWLLPANRRSLPEIDVMEVYGDHPNAVQMHLHPARGPVRGRVWRGLKPGWHRFALDWRRGRLTWFVDGVERWRLRGAAVPDQPMYLIADLAVNARPSRLPASFAIDWVRVTA